MLHAVRDERFCWISATKRFKMNTLPKTEKHPLTADNSKTVAEVMHDQHQHRAQSPDKHGLYDGPNSSYQLAFEDEEFMLRKETRGIRFQLEMLKPDLVMREMGIEHTIVSFGSARFPSPEDAQKLSNTATTPDEIKTAQLALKQSGYFQKAYDFGRIVAERNIKFPIPERLVVASGGGPGCMLAVNKGAFEVGDLSIGYNITLPFEQEPNPYITPKLCFQFFYFALRKINLVMRARAVLGFPGGFGTLDEVFEVATLIQTQKIKPIPLILVGKEYWTKFMNIEFLADEGAISQEDIDLIKIVDTAQEAWDLIKDFYSLQE